MASQLVLAAVLIDTIGFGIVIPVLPRLIVQLAQVPLAEATRIGGYMLIAFAAAQFIAGPIVGNLGDRYGRRPIILACMAAFALDYALMAAAPSLGWLFVGRLVAGITGAVYGPANALLADVTPPDQRGARFGMMGAMFGLGFIIGPALGGQIAPLGDRAPFIAAALLAAANAALIALLLPETLATDARRRFDWRRANPLGAFAPLRHAGGAGALIGVVLVHNIAHMAYPATWSFWAKLRFGWDEATIGLTLAASGVVMIATQALVTRRALRLLGEGRAIMVGASFAMTSFALYAVAREPWMVFAIIVFGFPQWLLMPSLNASLSRLVDASNQGALQGGIASIASIAAIIGPLVMTQTLAAGADAGYPGAAFALAATLEGVALIAAYWGIVRPLEPRRAPG